MTDPALAARPLQALWGALCAGGLAAVVVLGTLSATQGEPALPEHADTAFYACALASVVALGAGFWLLQRMEARLPSATSDAEALATVRGLGATAMAAVEASAVLAGVAAFVTGNLFALAFAVPLVAFTALTWPSPRRVAGWLALRAGRP